MRSDRKEEARDEIKEREEQRTPAEKKQERGIPGFASYHLLPVLVLSLTSALEIYIADQSITGAVRNFVTVALMSSCAVIVCCRWISLRLSVIITLLGIIASVQAVLPDFMIPLAAFSVLLAILSSNLYAGIFFLMLYSSLPFLVTERPFEYLLFYVITGLVGTALIFSRRKVGKFADYLGVFALIYILLFTALIVMKRSSMTPALIVGGASGLVLNVLIMEIAGYKYYDNIVKSTEELYLDVVDPEYPLLKKLKKTNKREFKRSIHTAHFTELFAYKFGYDPVLMKGLGFYHRIGVLRDGEASLAERTVDCAIDEGFPPEIVEGLRLYGGVKPGERISAEISIVIIVDTVIVSLMDEFSAGNKDLDLNRFIDKTILKLFSGRESLLKRSAIPYCELEEIRKQLKSERIYYDFLS